MFIVLDGMDGAGKSAMAQRLKEHLSERYAVVVTCEPTDGQYGNKIRALLKETDPQSRATELLELFIADRKEHIATLQPLLEKENTVVICDRYYYSTIAFQSTQGLDKTVLLEKNKEFPKPDLVLIFDLPVDVALARMKSRTKEKFEEQVFMEKLREAFLALEKELDDNIVVIDAAQSKEDVFKQVQKAVDAL